MKAGKFNVLLDGFFGSSGKGKMSAYLADKHDVSHISSSNFPNAGHTIERNGKKFIAKAIPTAAALKAFTGSDIKCWISPGSGFSFDRLTQEWDESGRPDIYIHDRASVVTPEHAERERSGSDSTKHLASTMQGSAAALVDKILRKKDCLLVGSKNLHEWTGRADHEFFDRVKIMDGGNFRCAVQGLIHSGTTWLHEGSQGYALSIDHGPHFPFVTSRNCNVQTAMDQMSIPPGMVGDVYLNLRTYPIRVGNVVEDGKQTGFSGNFYDDSRELTWDEVAKRSGMPPEEALKLTERERTTVTKRIRRVSTFSYIGLVDAVKTNGATKLCLNFVQYLDWKDKGLRGGIEAFNKLSKSTRQMIDNIEESSNLRVVLIGTGADHDDIIDVT